MPTRAKTLSQLKRPAPDNRPSAWKRGYDGGYLKLRKYHLKSNRICVRCEKEGYIVDANIVDHIIPHKGDRKLRLDLNNLQTLCKRHHDQKTATEDGGFGHKTN